MPITHHNVAEQVMLCGVSVACALLLTGSAALAAGPAAELPNIVLIVADDVGYSDFGCFGGEIQTPHIDRLAREGICFTDFYNNSVCIPTRASLLTGLYPRHVGEPRRIRLTQEMATIAEVLRNAGYRTSLSGKWHLGPLAPHRPLDRGFDEFYGLLDGCCNYFNPARRDPPYEGGRIRIWGHNNQRISEFPEDFYTTDAITEHAVGQIRRYAAEGAPFFVHVCYTAAHAPLHAKPQDIARYRGRYADGWDQLRRERWARQKQSGIVNPAWTLPLRESDVGSWEAEIMPAWQASLMEVYAAMVDCLDQGVGQILKALSETHMASRTVVLVLSDNGGSSGQPSGTDPTNIPGPQQHYTYCGKPWAYVQNTPFRRYKMDLYEGGIATPLIVRWPGVTAAGSRSRQVGHVVDLLPTLLEIAGAEYPALRGDEPLLPLEGLSLVPYLRGEPTTRTRTLYWFWQGNRAVRHDQWKLVWDPASSTWGLYDMDADRTETRNLAAEKPQLVQALAAEWMAWARQTGAAAALLPTSGRSGTGRPFPQERQDTGH